MRGNRQFKVDRNHQEIVEALRKAGISVVSLAVVGKGCGDLLCGYRGFNVLLEIKDGTAIPSKRVLTEDEAKFALHWRGQWCKVESTGEALAAVYEACGLRC